MSNKIEYGLLICFALFIFLIVVSIIGFFVTGLYPDFFFIGF